MQKSESCPMTGSWNYHQVTGRTRDGYGGGIDADSQRFSRVDETGAVGDGDAGGVGDGDGDAGGVGVCLTSGADVVFGGGGEYCVGDGSSGGADSVSGATALAEDRLQRAVAEGVAGKGGGSYDSHFVSSRGAKILNRSKRRERRAAIHQTLTVLPKSPPD